jgi:hypothetical protein
MLALMEPNLPDDSLEFIRSCVRQGKVFWTYHVSMRLRGRFIHRQAILQSHEHYEIIEEYPKDKYLPSYLVYSEYQDDIFHILFAVDLKEEMFGLSLPIVLTRKSGKLGSGKGGTSHEMQCLWFKIKAVDYRFAFQDE